MTQIEGSMHIIQTLRHWIMSFSNFTKEISNGIHQMEGHLEMAKIEIAFEKRDFKIKNYDCCGKTG